MIVIYTEDNDVTTNYVIEWLSVLYDGKVKRINTDFFKISKDEDYFHNFSNSEEVKSIWYRRPGRIAVPIRNIPERFLNEKIDRNLEHRLMHSANKELAKVNEYDLLHKYKAENILGNALVYDVNKFDVLRISKNIGIDIPNSILTNSKSELIKFFHECNGEIIIKLHEMLLSDVEETHSTFATYTERVELSFINKLPNHFFISHFQEKIEKDYEIRSFYLDGEIFSMAMFTQKDDNTNVDFRRYNRDKMSRRVPYKLPSKLEDKIRLLMKKLDLNCGSMDIIKTNNKYVFLEVNPVGQFGFVSSHCNYYLHKKIAEYLIR